VAIHRYAKALLLAPSIGSSLIGILGLLVGVVLIFGRGKNENQTLAGAGRHAALAVSAPRDLQATLRTSPAQSSDFASDAAASGSDAQLLRTGGTPRVRAVRQERRKLAGVLPNKVSFQKPIASDRLEFLTGYAGRSTNEVVHEPGLRNLVDTVVPYAPFHLGLDMPLPHAIETMLSLSSTPVAVREDRYVMLTGTRGSNGRGRAFLWIDTHEGLVLGGIFFYPSNGEPTPTLTIFSRQVNQQSLRMSQFPSAFVQDLTEWAAAAGVPPITTRYFINASSEKTVLAHDEDFCKHVGGMAVPQPDACKRMNAEAAHIDVEASQFLNQTNYASNATMRMVATKPAVGGAVVP
jgi:hypothetical protein